jgi:hypothetical protein
VTDDRLFIEGVDPYTAANGARIATPYLGVVEFRGDLTSSGSSGSSGSSRSSGSSSQTVDGRPADSADQIARYEGYSIVAST